MRPIAFLSLLAVFFIWGCGAQRVAQQGEQPFYLPPQVRGVYIGMPYEAFRKMTPKQTITEVVIPSLRYELTVPAEAPLKEITYYFGTEGEMPLYEMIFSYADTLARNDFAESAFGIKVGSGQQVRKPQPAGYDLLAWTFKDRLVVAANLIQTELSDW